MPIDNEKQEAQVQESQVEREASTPELRKLADRQRELELLTMKRDSVAKRLHDIEEPLPVDLPESQRKNVEANAVLYREELAKFDAQIKALEKEIADMNAVISRNKHFDKYLLFQNIRELMKGTEIKLGQIEKEAGCQPGYMSRLDKTENASDPTAEFIITAAQMLKVSVDVLLNVKISELTPSERYIGSFLEKMVRDTVADKLTWNRETANTLNSVSTDQNGNPQHPLFETVEYYEQNGYSDYPERMERVLFPSKAFEQKTIIAGDCYNIRLKNGTLLFLMSVAKGEDALPFDDWQATEVWMYQPGVPASCLCSTQNHAYIAGLVSDLYEAVAQNIKHPKVMKDYQHAINAFMNDDLTDDPASSDELPF